MDCKICDSSEGKEHTFQERMFGLHETFLYWECDGCGCLQLVKVPDNLEKYYTSDQYYSLQSAELTTPHRNGFRGWFKHKRDAALLFQQRGIFSQISRYYPNPGISDIQRWLAPTNVRSYDSSILDIGCGNGQLLFRLRDLGFKSLTGVDPFLSSERQDQGVQLLACSLESMQGSQFDFIMLHHSLEHMPNQLEVFTQINRLLSDNGVCLIRIPIKSQGPWKQYGTHWVELDAPRHTFLHTEQSLKHVATAANLHLTQIDYEADPFPYYGSELYLKGKSLVDPLSKKTVDWNQIYSEEERQQFQALATKNNTPGKAGRAAFYFKKHPSDHLTTNFV